MKTPFKSLAAGITFLAGMLFLFSDCNIVPISNLKTVEITYQGRDTFTVKAGSAAGIYSVENQVIVKNIEEFLKKNGISKKDVATVKLDSARVTIPAASNLDFDALEEGVLNINGLSALGSNVEKIILTFPKISGKTALLVSPVKDTYDVRKLITGANLIVMDAKLKTNRATPRSDMYLRYSFTIGYQVAQ